MQAPIKDVWLQLGVAVCLDLLPTTDQQSHRHKRRRPRLPHLMRLLPPRASVELVTAETGAVVSRRDPCNGSIVAPFLSIQLFAFATFSAEKPRHKLLLLLFFACLCSPAILTTMEHHLLCNLRLEPSRGHLPLRMVRCRYRLLSIIGAIAVVIVVSEHRRSRATAFRKLSIASVLLSCI